MIISPLDEQRIKYINHLMDNIHDQSSEIYESLVDKDFNEAEHNIDKLISTLNNIKSTFKDEIQKNFSTFVLINSVCFKFM